MVSAFEQQGIKTLFEGIEEGWQLELAEQSGASMVQGFALARPQIVPADFHAFGRSGEAATGKVAQAEAGAGEAPAARPQKPARAFGRRIVP
jgi:EAL domain-containing protein (putative c-di-GMP-specific phosphodiesterase class I)